MLWTGRREVNPNLKKEISSQHLLVPTAQAESSQHPSRRQGCFEWDLYAGGVGMDPWEDRVKGCRQLAFKCSLGVWILLFSGEVLRDPEQNHRN